MPAAAGVLGLVGALAVPGLAVIGAVGSVAALMNKYSLEIKNEENMSQQDRNDVDI